MCGIIATVRLDATVDVELFQRQCNAIRHRGPDDSGIWLNSAGRVALGNRRLAIRDLSDKGHMPLSDPSKQIWLTFNGEIYNYPTLRSDLEQLGYCFQSGSDTEVLLAAYCEWDTDCLHRINGMFAFAIYDGRLGKERLFVARDRAGEKPLYYWSHKQGITFASELKAIMADPTFSRRLDLSAFNLYLSFGYVPGSNCILTDVNKLPPAHALTYKSNTGEMHVWRYWVVPQYARQPALDSIELTDKLQSLLSDAVSLQLLADVPVGVLLSGGLDSSLVTALAAQSSSLPIKTFTICFPGHDVYDERRYAKQVSTYFGTKHYELEAEVANVDLLPQLAAIFDEPLADSSLVHTYLVSRLTRDYVTVSLGGDGGDELFGGYLHYNSSARKQNALMRRLPLEIRSLAIPVAQKFPVGLPGRNYLLGSQGSVEQGCIFDTLFFDEAARYQIMSPAIREAVVTRTNGPESERLAAWPLACDLVDAMTRMDFQFYLPDDILTKVDRASMAVSLEMRSTWLDYRLIEFAFNQVPSHWKATSDERKRLPRLLAKRLLPAGLDIQRKQGLSIPLTSWFKGEWGVFFREILTSAPPALFDQHALQSLIEGQERGYKNTARLFALTMFELWRREYRIAF